MKSLTEALKRMLRAMAFADTREMLSQADKQSVLAAARSDVSLAKAYETCETRPSTGHPQNRSPLQRAMTAWQTLMQPQRGEKPLMEELQLLLGEHPGCHVVLARHECLARSQSRPW